MTRLNKPQSKLTWLWVVVAIVIFIAVLAGLEYLNLVHLGVIQCVKEVLRWFQQKG